MFFELIYLLGRGYYLVFGKKNNVCFDFEEVKMWTQQQFWFFGQNLDPTPQKTA